MAVFRVHKNKNYTTMSNHHLRNAELSLKAKGLHSQMLSLPDTWNYTIEGLAAINKEGVSSINNILMELEQFGYLRRTRVRNEAGQLKGTEYDVYEEPIVENPEQDNPEQEKPEQGKPEQENRGQLNTKEINKEELNIDYINNLSNPIPSLNSFPLDGGNVDNSKGRERKGRDDNPSPYSFWERQIKTNVDYESLMQSYPYDHKLIDELIAIMVETVMSNRKMIRIAGDDYPFSVVKEKFLGIDYSHIQYIIDCFNDAARNKEIKNIKQYMKALIFNAPSTIDSYFTAKVRYDMPWLGQNHSD